MVQSKLQSTLKFQSLILFSSKSLHLILSISLILDNMSTTSEVQPPQPEPPIKLQSKPSTVRTSRNSRTGHRQFPSPEPLQGFDKAVFAGQEKVVANFCNYIRIFDIHKHGYGLRDVKCEGAVACLQNSPDFAHLAVSVDAIQGAKIVMYDTREMDAPVREFSTV